MRVAFLSNFLNHHQEPFCKEMIRILGVDNFRFIALERQADEQNKLGYLDKNNAEFCIRYYESESDRLQSVKWINEADVVLVGGVSYRYVFKRWLRGKTVIKYGERIEKKGKEHRTVKETISMFLFHTINVRRTDYFLAASAYAAGDYWRHHAHRNRVLKWGYFPECYDYAIDELLSQKNKNEIIWCGRLIDWKHPETIIEVAKRLKQSCIPYFFTVVGEGPLKEKLRHAIEEEQLNVQLVGAVSSDKVRSYMTHAGIMLASSDYNEGWGAVINEGMNSGCAMVASIAMGAVPFLIQDGINGRTYDFHNTEECYELIKELLQNKDKQEALGKCAYLSITQMWNARIAAQRLVDFLRGLEQGKVVLSEDGPCSKAELILNPTER